ncbi:MAG: tRNA glutamyl-Q(34) synthetase GluQRS [Deltaproteobacteria bacterium]|nr:tRNA glutamyl-Q(34) synthetase GluQRS [Deltaproteobacteria bacterium]
MTTPYVGRLAPSPTARQHIGNLRTALVAWLDARAHGGRLILRIEDLDPARSRPEFENQIIEDFRAMGLDWDEGPGATAGPAELRNTHSPYRQSERAHYYRKIVTALEARNLVYPCFCSRKEIETAAGAPAPGEDGPRYPGTCRHLPPADASRRISGGESYAFRFRADDRLVTMTDIHTGAAAENVSTLRGDFIVFRKDGVASYQLAVVADDRAMGVTCVVRGADLLDSTARQVLLYEALGWTPPGFLHVPLVTGLGGRKFAKRERDITLPELLHHGWTVEKILGYLAHSLGLLDRPEPVTPAGLLPHYRRDRLSDAPWEVDPGALLR